MAEKVLNLFWNLAHANDVAIDIMDQALSAHIKILDYSCTQYRETQKTRWLGMFHKKIIFMKNFISLHLILVHIWNKIANFEAILVLQ